jgi:hypothetical protein
VNPDDNDAWDLATLAAQVLCRQNSPLDAVDAAWALFEAAKDKLEGVRLEALAKSPEAQAAWEAQQAEYLTSLKLPYEKGVKLITGQTRWSYALKWFKEFLKYQGAKRGEKDVTAYVEARLVHYRAKDFTGTEAKKLRTEFLHWRGKGRQGRVRNLASDGRLKANREKKRQAKGKEALAELTKPKVEFKDAVRPFINRGRKSVSKEIVRSSFPVESRMRISPERKHARVSA